MVYITGGLLDVLLSRAAEADPQSETIQLALVDADQLGIEEVDDDAEVFGEFYLPETGNSIEAVFGMNVSVPPGQTPGIFISHPNGELSVTTTDELAERIFIAIPPWERSSVSVFDRRGRERQLKILEAYPEHV